MAAKFPPPSPPFIKAKYHGGSQKPKAIVMHGTVSSDNKGTARNIARWWQNPPVKTSAHYIVDPGEVIQSVGDHTIAYHCGFNTGSIGVELCDEQTGPATRWNDADSKAILKRAARLVAELCLAYGIAAKRPSIKELKAKGPHGIYGHNDSRLAFGGTSHTDPREFPWRKFMRMVRKEIRAIKGEVKEKRRAITVLHAPLHGATATKAELKKALFGYGADRIGFTEAWRKSGWLSRRKAKFRPVVSGNKCKDARGRMNARSTVLMVRKSKRKHFEHGVVKGCDAATPLKIAPERYLAYSVDMEQGAPLATIMGHNQAAVRKNWDSKRAATHRDYLRALVKLVRGLRRKYGKGLGVVVMMDANYPAATDGRTWTTLAVLRRLGLEPVVYDGIDVVAASKNLEVAGKDVIRANGQNHPWIRVRLRRR